MFLACNVKLTVLEVLFWNGSEHVKLELFLVSFPDLREAPHDDKVHSIAELKALGENSQAAKFAQPVHMFTSNRGIHGRYTRQEPANEEHNEIAKLCDFVRP